MDHPLLLREQQALWNQLRHVRAYLLYHHLYSGTPTTIGAFHNATNGRDVAYETKLYNARARAYGLPPLPTNPEQAWSPDRLNVMREHAVNALRAAAHHKPSDDFLVHDPNLYGQFSKWHRQQMVIHAEMMAYETGRSVARQFGAFGDHSKNVVVPVGKHAKESPSESVQRLSREYQEWTNIATEHGARGLDPNTFRVGDLMTRGERVVEQLEDQFGPHDTLFARHMEAQGIPPPLQDAAPAPKKPPPAKPLAGVTASLPYLLPATAAAQPTLSGLQADLANQLRQQPPTVAPAPVPPALPPAPVLAEPPPKPKKGKGKRVDFSNAPARMEDDPHVARMERMGRIVGTEGTQASGLQRAEAAKSTRKSNRSAKQQAKRAAERDPDVEIIPRSAYRQQLRAWVGLYPMQAEPERDFLGDADVRRDMRNTGRAGLYDAYYEALMRELIALVKSSTRASQQALRVMEAQRQQRGLPVLTEQMRSRDIDRLLQHPHIRDRFRTQFPDYYVALVRAYGTLDPALWLRLMDREATNLAFELQAMTVEEAVGVTPAQLMQSLIDRDTSNNSFRGPHPMGTTVVNHEMAWTLFRTHLEEGLGLKRKRSITFGANRVDWQTAFLAHDFYDTLNRPESLLALHRQLLVESGQSADILGNVPDGPAMTPAMAAMINADAEPERTAEPLLSINYANPGVEPVTKPAGPLNVEAAKQAEAQARYDQAEQGMHNLDLPEPFSSAMAEAILRPEAAATVLRRGNSLIDQNEFLMERHLQFMHRLDEYVLAHVDEASRAVQAGGSQYDWALSNGAFDQTTLRAFNDNLTQLIDNQRDALLWMGGTLGPAAQAAMMPGGTGTRFLNQHQVWRRYQPVYRRMVAALQTEHQMLRIGNEDLQDLLPILDPHGQALLTENRKLYRSYRTLLDGNVDPKEFYAEGKYQELKGEDALDDDGVQPTNVAEPIVPAPSPGAASVTSATESWPSDYPDQPGDNTVFGQALAARVEGEGPVPPLGTTGLLVDPVLIGEDRDADAESLASAESTEAPSPRAPIVLRPPSYYESEAQFTGRPPKALHFRPYAPPSPIATRTRNKTRAAFAASLGQPPPIPLAPTDLEEDDVPSGRPSRVDRAKLRKAERIEKRKNEEFAALQARIDVLQKQMDEQAAQHTTRMQELQQLAEEAQTMEVDDGGLQVLNGQNGALVLIQQQQQDQMVQYNQNVQQIQNQIAQAEYQQLHVNQQAEARLRRAFQQAVLQSDLAIDVDFVQAVDPEAADNIRSFRAANRNPIQPRIEAPAGAAVVAAAGQQATGAHRPIDHGMFFNPATNTYQLSTQGEQYAYNYFRQAQGLAPLPFSAFGRAPQASPPMNPPQQALPAPAPVPLLAPPAKPAASKAPAKPAPSGPVAGLLAPPQRGPGPLPAPPPQLIQAVQPPPAPGVVPYQYVARAAAGAVQEELHSMLQRHRVNPGRARSALANLLRQSYIDAGVHRPANRFRDRMVPFNF